VIALKGNAVVVGMGYVGIPLSCVLAKAGNKVTGIDIDEKKVAMINSGKLPLIGKEPELPELLQEQVRRGAFRATTDFSACREAEAVFISVDTPIDDNKEPLFGHLQAAVEHVGENISPGVLVVIESTMAPGTMRDRILPTLERKSGLSGGKDLFLAHCPERVMSGKLLNNIRKIDRIVGGFDDRSRELALKWYSQFVEGDLHPTDMTVAETAKTAENAYRDVNIAFANEVGLICEKLGIDAFEVRKLVNTCPGRAMLFPGAGVGGHCIPKDSWLLVYGGRAANPELLPIIRKINDMMPQHTVELAMQLIEREGLKSGKETCICILGLSYLENSGDTRNTPAKGIIDKFRGKYRLIAHDPYVSDFENVEMIEDLESALEAADCAIFLTKHQEYVDLALEKIAALMKHRLIVDGRDIFDKAKAEELGISYAGVGKG